MHSTTLGAVRPPIPPVHRSTTAPKFAAAPQLTTGEEYKPSRLQLAPPWLVSLIVHLSLIILLALFSIDPGSAGPGDGLILKIEGANSGDDAGDILDASEPVSLAAVVESVTSQANEAASTAEVPFEAEPLDISDMLPQAASTNLAAAGGGSSDSSDTAGNSGDAFELGDGNTTTSLFGVPGTGQKFVYVFDRSLSMEYPFYTYVAGQERAVIPLQAAKAQLLKSINELTSAQRFQVVFYNHVTDVFDLGAHSAKSLVRATRENRMRASQIVSYLPALGSTNHVPAIATALKMQPDVIFLLTDGEPKDDPTNAQVNALRELNRRKTVINVIHFGETGRSDSTLVKLARANRGKYLFINLMDLEQAAGVDLPGQPPQAANFPDGQPRGPRVFQFP